MAACQPLKHFQARGIYAQEVWRHACATSQPLRKYEGEEDSTATGSLTSSWRKKPLRSSTIIVMAPTYLNPPKPQNNLNNEKIGQK
eukprot:3286846-Amphidinium_carterae.1